MTQTIGEHPPLHRRFNEAESLQLIRNRYRNLHRTLAGQVKVLQDDIETRIIFRSFYEADFKDWHLLSAIYNVRMNWHFGEFGISLSDCPSKERLKEVEEIITLSIERPSRFANNKLIEEALRLSDVTCLPTYGFECRRADYSPDAVRSFLQHRMRHYDLDLPHRPLFGKPPGDWPEYGPE
jgi:hypothetical protein